MGRERRRREKGASVPKGVAISRVHLGLLAAALFSLALAHAGGGTGRFLVFHFLSSYITLRSTRHQINNDPTYPILYIPGVRKVRYGTTSRALVVVALRLSVSVALFSPLVSYLFSVLCFLMLFWFKYAMCIIVMILFPSDKVKDFAMVMFLSLKAHVKAKSGICYTNKYVLQYHFDCLIFSVNEN